MTLPVDSCDDRWRRFASRKLQLARDYRGDDSPGTKKDKSTGRPSAALRTRRYEIAALALGYAGDWGQPGLYLRNGEVGNGLPREMVDPLR